MNLDTKLLSVIYFIFLMLPPERILAKYLKQTALGEKCIERARQELAQETLFNPQATFAALDHNHKGYLCLNDVFQFLK
jgi:hypothetical protein